MLPLLEVEEAKALLQEAMDWSIWQWLFEKGRVRRMADRGTAALNELDKKVRASWRSDLKKAYRALETQSPNKVDGIEQQIKLAARKVKQAHDEADRARIEAEETFDEAERILSASLAREGARLAIRAYDLREVAIRKAESAARRG